MDTAIVSNTVSSLAGRAGYDLVRKPKAAGYGRHVGTPRAELERVIERRRAVALAQHFRYAEGLSTVQIANRLGRSPATVKAYFYDPTGAKARAVKARYQGVPRLRCLHAAGQRQGRCLRVLQELPPWGDPGSLDTRAGARGDAGVAHAVRPAALLLRLVAHPRPPT
jgi:hypothetical protein